MLACTTQKEGPIKTTYIINQCEPSTLNLVRPSVYIKASILANIKTRDLPELGS